MIRVVLDTNVIVSALLRQQGIPARILAAVYTKIFRAFVSIELFAEYEKVLTRPRLKIPDPDVQGLLSWYRAHATWVEPIELLRACSDSKDDMVLACAHAARVDFLITGNSTDFPEQWHRTSVVTPRRFAERHSLATGLPARL
jgi:putative PIN family toxin of toxin-antitoxin system